MNKQEIIKRNMSMIDWVKSISSIPDEMWFLPFAEGKWGTADVIAHFISWDKFLIENRLDYIVNNQQVPIVAVDVEEVNQEASRYARSGIAKEDLINEFVATRQKLVHLLEQINSHRYETPIFDGKEITLSEYLIGDIEHEQKHKQQIDWHIMNNS